MGAEVPEMKPDVLIIESTWGIRTIPPIEEREKRFTGEFRRVFFLFWIDSFLIHISMD